MLVLKEYNSLFFDKIKMIIFLKTLNYCYKDHEIKDLIKRRDCLIKYTKKNI